MALSATAVEFVPGKYWSGLQVQEEPDYIVELKDILYQLSIDPGTFEAHMNNLTGILTAAIHEDWQLEEVADIIFEQSVMEPNFTYSGVRVIESLNRLMPIPPGRKDIRMFINQRAKDVVVRKNEMAIDPSQQRRLHGVTIFMAELFMNMEIIAADGIRQKIRVYRLALQELFQSLTDYPSEANLKCLGNVFKLAGKTIEDYDRYINNTESSELINKIFNDGRDYIVNGKIDKTIREQWLHLIEYRASDWGRRSVKGQRSDEGLDQPGPGGAAVMNGVGGAGDLYGNIPVFYSPDGTVISAKEAGYNEDLFTAEEYVLQDMDPNDLNFDPALDTYGWQPEFGNGYQEGITPDMEDAYESFLRETGQDDHNSLSWGVE